MTHKLIDKACEDGWTVAELCEVLFCLDMSLTIGNTPEYYGIVDKTVPGNVRKMKK